MRFRVAGDNDNDGDGVTLCLDCNDDDDTVTAGSPEACNGIDDDCNGIADFGSPGIANESDEDNDGALRTAMTAMTWTPAVSPANPEICDGLDQNCDGIPDDGPDLRQLLPGQRSGRFGRHGLSAHHHLRRSTAGHGSGQPGL